MITADLLDLASIHIDSFKFDLEPPQEDSFFLKRFASGSLSQKLRLLRLDQSVVAFQTDKNKRILSDPSSRNLMVLGSNT